jgi:amidase
MRLHGLRIRRLAVAALLLGLSVSAGAECRFRLLEADLEAINRALQQGCIDSQSLVRRYLARIQAYEPQLNAIISLNPRALERARALDAERYAWGPRTPLHGIPILVTDNFDIQDMPTTAGNVALRYAIPQDDGFVVRRLREAGAIVIGKANMSELAQSHGRLGYSSVGGLTRNPYRLNRDASGSSTGAAVGVAANFAALGIGTDTADSVRGPASTTALVGIRPTLGLVSRDGIVPAALSLDTPGPLARSVADATVALGIMAGVDEADPRTLPSRGRVKAGYTRYLDANALRGARVGVVRDYLGGNPQVDATFERSLERMAELGAELVEVALPEEVKAAVPRVEEVLAAELRPQLAMYLKSLRTGAPASFRDFVRRTKAAGWGDGLYGVNPKLVESLNKALAHPGLGDIDYLYTVSNRLPAARAALHRLFREQRLNGLTFPTLVCPPGRAFGERPDSEYLCRVDHAHNAGYLRIASVTGFPDISVPAGMTRAGLPVGLSFLGLPYSEPTLIGLAYAFEQHTKVRRPPARVPAVRPKTRAERQGPADAEGATPDGPG